MTNTPQTATDLRNAFLSGSRSATDIVEEHLEAIEARDGILDAFLTEFPEGLYAALAQARLRVPMTAEALGGIAADVAIVEALRRAALDEAVGGSC